MAVTYHGQILGIFIRDVTTPLLMRTPSSSSISLPYFFDGNGQPAPRQGPLAQLKELRESWRAKSQEAVPTMSNLDMKDDTETELDQMTLHDIDLIIEAESAGQDVFQDLPLQDSMTPPPHSPRPQRIRSNPSIRSTNSETPTDFSLQQTYTGRIEEHSRRVKHVETWKRRLARSREKLLMANSSVEIWTWRVGGDVDKICEELVMKGIESEYKGVKDILQETRV
jgi:hypothetical protein